MPVIILRTFLTAFIIMAITIFLVSPVILGDEEEKSEMVGETSVITDLTTVLQDSIYAEINAGFARLEHIFERGCYDCHTTRTKYPWYHKIPGIKHLINSDIKEGLEHLDMSDGFPFQGKPGIPYQSEKLDEIKEVLKEGEMPIFMYRMIHWGASPSDEEKDSIYIWVDESLKALEKLH
ncbi:MAG: heme-binding domain-containing protein [Candidatus Zixiibacteriota bacterium]